jgi:hypothetical protein
MPKIPDDYFLMSDVYPKCRNCGSFRLARYDEITTDRSKLTDDWKAFIWLGNALLLKHYACLDCGEKDTDWDDIEVRDERLLP